jgi:lipid A 3-O-deacylase
VDRKAGGLRWRAALLSLALVGCATSTSTYDTVPEDAEVDAAVAEAFAPDVEPDEVEAEAFEPAGGWPEVEVRRPNGAVGFALDNDLFAGSDRHYTNGLRIALLFAPPRALETWAADFGCGVDWGLVAGQKIFTPEDLASEAPVTDDRPYAGWLYGGIVLRLRGGGAWDGEGSAPVLDTFELDLGFVGKASLADDTQRWAHDRLDNDEPLGWRNQVQQGFSFQLSWLRQVRLFAAELPAGLELDVVPHFGLTLGSVLIGARGGATARLGWNLPADFGGLEDDVLALPLARAGDAPRPQRWGAWLLCRTDLRATMFDATLDAGLASGEHRVRHEPLVASIELGAMFALGERLLFGYTHTLRSPEFHSQEGPDGFGSLFVQIAY